MDKKYMDLLELQSVLKSGIESCVEGRVWVKAEIGAMKARVGGHCYLELIQNGDNGLLAKANAIIWSSKFGMISRYFYSVAGSELQEGMQILAQVQVNYSQIYGLSLIVNDIDPEFTLGSMALERRQTIRRLEKEGLMSLQKELSIEPLPYRLAVVSASDAAGYRDFMKHLHENEYGFVFHTDLFPALMQGRESPSSIIDAIELASGSAEPYDAILVLRGGGGKMDLSCYDDYSLSAAIARCPIPVFTAVGHDQDYHVCDMVSFCSVKTPTALADEFVGYYQVEDERISSYSSKLKTAFVGRIASMESTVSVLESRIRTAFLTKVSSMESAVALLESKIKSTALGKITSMESAISVLESRIHGQDPRNILKRGYVLVLDPKGRVLKSASAAQIGDSVGVMFGDGRLICEVKDIKK